MKTIVITLLSVATFGATLPAFAGPDWQIIEHGRKVKLAQLQQANAQSAAQQSSTDGSAPQSQNCMGMNGMDMKGMNGKSCSDMMKDKDMQGMEMKGKDGKSCSDMMKGMDMKGMDMKGMDSKSCGEMMKSMKGQQAASAGVHHTSGVVKAIDTAKGTVTLAHGPVKSLNWPAMTMTYIVKDKRLLEQLAVNKTANVDFVQEGQNYVVTAVQ